MSKRTEVKEQEGGGVPMSVGGGAVPSLTNPSDVYALQLKKRLNKKMLRRKTPKL